MADERIRQAVKITDPLTDANEAGVDGSGNLQTVDTNLVTAVALADNLANPTTTQVGAMAMLWDGATWDRAPGNSVDGIKVDLGSDNDVTITSGLVNVQGPTASDAPLTAAPVTIGGRASTATPAAVSLDGDVVNAWLDLRGAQKMVVVDDAGDSVMDGANNAVQVAIVSGANTVDTELPAAAALSDTLANPTAPAVGSHLMGFDRVGTNWTRIAGVVDGEVVGALNAGFLSLGTDGTNYQVIATDASGNLQVDILSGGGGPEDTDDDIVAGGQTAVLGIAMTYGFDGTQWERVTTDAAGSMDVNVTLALPTGTNEIGDVGSINMNVVPGVAATSLGKAESAAHTTGDTGVAMWAVRDDTPVGLAADGQYIPLTTDSVGRLHVTDPNAGAGTPTNPTVEHPALANIAAGATSLGTALRTADLGGTTQQLAGFDVSGSAPFKFTLISEIDDVETIETVGFGVAGRIEQWTPPNKAYFNVVFAANAGFDGWRVEVDNLDNSQTTDFYVTFYRED